MRPAKTTCHKTYWNKIVVVALLSSLPWSHPHPEPASSNSTLRNNQHPSNSQLTHTHTHTPWNCTRQHQLSVTYCETASRNSTLQSTLTKFCVTLRASTSTVPYAPAPCCSILRHTHTHTPFQLRVWTSLVFFWSAYLGKKSGSPTALKPSCRESGWRRPHGDGAAG